MTGFQKINTCDMSPSDHIVWAPKYGYRVIKVEADLRYQNNDSIFLERLDCEVIELNVWEEKGHLPGSSHP